MSRRAWRFGFRLGDLELHVASEPQRSLLPLSPWLIERVSWLALGLVLGDLVHRHLG